MSHAYAEIMFNNDVDNRCMSRRCIYVVIRGIWEFCKQCKCQMSYPRGNICEQTVMSRTFKPGNGDDDACQMPCYNLYDNSKDEDGVAIRVSTFYAL